MKLQFQPNRTNPTCFYRCPECQCEFYGGEKTRHEKSCQSKPGYADCVVVFGPKFIERAKKWSRMNGIHYKYGPAAMSFQDIQEQIPRHIWK